MRRSKPPVTTPRKRPVQARSTRLVADILEAAIRVLEREGAQRFTTIRIAAEAGVSVGSLYQYFPNKQAILFPAPARRMGAHRCERSTHCSAAHDALAPEQRLRATIRAFFHSECDERAAARLALDGAPRQPYRDAPESRGTTPQEAAASSARSSCGRRTSCQPWTCAASLPS